MTGLLPVSFLQKVSIRYLDAVQIGKLRICCSEWNQALDDSSMWNSILKRDFPNYPKQRRGKGQQKRVRVILRKMKEQPLLVYQQLSSECGLVKKHINCISSSRGRGLNWANLFPELVSRVWRLCTGQTIARSMQVNKHWYLCGTAAVRGSELMWTQLLSREFGIDGAELPQGAAAISALSCQRLTARELYRQWHLYCNKEARRRVSGHHLSRLLRALVGSWVIAVERVRGSDGRYYVPPIWSTTESCSHTVKHRHENQKTGAVHQFSAYPTLLIEEDDVFIKCKGKRCRTTIKMPLSEWLLFEKELLIYSKDFKIALEKIPNWELIHKPVDATGS